jgi:hypothetical protein
MSWVEFLISKQTAAREERERICSPPLIMLPEDKGLTPRLLRKVYEKGRLALSLCSIIEDTVCIPQVRGQNRGSGLLAFLASTILANIFCQFQKRTDAVGVFEDDWALSLREEVVSGEQRLATVGTDFLGRVLVVI